MTDIVEQYLVELNPEANFVGLIAISIPKPEIVEHNIYQTKSGK